MASDEDAAAPAAPARPIRVVVDDREPAETVLAALQRMPEVEAIVSRLPVGDYQVDDECLIERKTVSDFAASIVDGRLFRQARRLAGASPLCAVILEGRASDLSGCPVSRESLQGAMVSLSLIYRLPVLRALTPEETAQLILYAGRQIRRQTGVFFKAGRRPKAKRRRQLRLLQAFPGVGPDRAARLLEAFGTVHGVLNAEPAALEAVHGIGPTTAAAIQDLLRENPEPYRGVSPLDDF